MESSCSNRSKLGMGVARIPHQQPARQGRCIWEFQCASASPSPLKSVCLQAERCRGMSLPESFSGDIPDPPGHGAVQPALGDPASAGGWAG